MGELARESYRGADNPKNPKPRKLPEQPKKLVPRADVPQEERPPLLPGRRSRRQRKNVWVDDG